MIVMARVYGTGYNQERTVTASPQSFSRTPNAWPRNALAIAMIALVSLAQATTDGSAGALPEMIRLPGGTLEMGSDTGPQEERPRHRRRVDAFLLARSPTTVAQFAAFVASSGHVTSAEKYGNSAVMSFEDGRWRLVEGADWRHPLGPDSEASADHPVVHVSWHDAGAYCSHHGMRLPTEAEWEHAAKNASRSEAVYAFGDHLVRDGDFLANVWTGRFPHTNTGADGYLHTSPVGAFGRTPLGLTDMAGNVWEWSADWFLPYTAEPGGFTPGPGSAKAQRGGSYLCDQEVCHGFRTTARGHSTQDSSHMHVGFRCAADLPGN